MQSPITLENLFDEYITLKSREVQILATWNEFKARQIAELKEKNQMLQDALTEKGTPNG